MSAHVLVDFVNRVVLVDGKPSPPAVLILQGTPTPPAPVSTESNPT